MSLPAKFFDMPIPEQCWILYLEGEFVMAIRYYEFKINLYNLGNKMVEVFYNHKLDKIHKIQPLDDASSRMNFYADQVSLEGLLITEKGN